MRVPTADYSPLIQAHQNRKAANSVKNVSAKLDYQRKSQELERQGLQLKGEAIQLNDNYNRFQTGIQIGKMLAAAASAAEAAQSQKASAMVNKMQGDTRTMVAEGISDGSMYFTPNEVGAGVRRNAGETVQNGMKFVGGEKLDALKQQQIAEINSQPWSRSVKDKAIEALDSFYYENNNRMLQEYYAKETDTRFKLEQFNMDNAINADSAAGSYYTTQIDDSGNRVQVKFADYTNIDKFINENESYSEKTKELLMASTHAQIDMNRAMNEVRNATIAQGQVVGEAVANQIADEENYSPETRQKLIGFANHTSSQAAHLAAAQGTQFVNTTIQSALDQNAAPDFSGMYQQATETTATMSPEAGEAFMGAVEKGHLKWCSDKSTGLLSGIDKRSTAELEQILADLDSDKSSWEGTTATQALYDATVAAVEKQLLKETIPEYQQKATEAVADWENRIMELDDFSEDNIKAITQEIENDPLLKRDVDHGIKDNTLYVKRLLDTAVADHVYEGLESKIIEAEDLKGISGEIDNNKLLSRAQKSSLKKALAREIKTREQLDIAERRLIAQQQAQAEKDYVDIEDAMMKSWEEDVKTGRINGYTFMDNLDGVIRAVYGKYKNGELNSKNYLKLKTTADKLRNSIIPDTKTRYKEPLKEASDFITLQYEKKYGNAKNLPQEVKDRRDESIKHTQGRLIDLALELEGMDDAKVSAALEQIKKDYLLENYDTLSRPNEVGFWGGDTKYKAAMRDIADLQESSAVYYDDKAGEFKWDGKTKEKFDSASLNVRDMLREDYDLDVQNEYRTQEVYGPDGSKLILPAFISKDDKDVAYTVYNGEVYRLRTTTVGRGDNPIKEGKSKLIYRILGNPIQPTNK